MSSPDARADISAAIGVHEYTGQVTSGQIPLPGFAVDFVQVSPIIAAFRRMVRELEFDVCELAPTTYLAAREASVKIMAIPVFLTREFHFGSIVCGEGTGIERPADLEGRRVGVRAYTVSTGVWVRSLLKTEYGVDPDSITWIVDDEEHVQEIKLPPNVIQAPNGTSLAALFEAGEIDAAFSGPAGIGRSGPPSAGWEDAQTRKPSAERSYYPLFENAADLNREYYRSTGIYPLHGLVAMKTSVAEQYPDLGRLLLQAFETAKQPFLASLRSGAHGAGRDYTHYGAMAEIVGDDPLPFGIADNRPSIDALIEAALDQHILSSRPAVEDLFLQ